MESLKWKCQEKLIKFPVYKDRDGALKEPTWKQIEPRALELGLHRLHRMVRGEDLFVREANFHQSCHKSFNLKYTNHLQYASQTTAQANNHIADT